jgi:hypothetical protein
MTNRSSISSTLQEILDSYLPARRGVNGKFGRAHPVFRAFQDVVDNIRKLPSVRFRPNLQVGGSVGKGQWAGVPWIALMDQRETSSTQNGVYVVFLFRQDMSGVYLTLNQGVTQLKKLHGIPEARLILNKRAKQLEALIPRGDSNQTEFIPGSEIDLNTDGSLGTLYEHSTAAAKLYERDRIPSDDQINADLEVLLSAYDAYMNSDLRKAFAKDASSPFVDDDAGKQTSPTVDLPPDDTEFDMKEAMEALLAGIKGRGFVFEPWQVAQYVASVRTKPFVILAGITGTGKSKLPRLVEEATGGRVDLIPVRPDWTDSSEALGYVDIEGAFRPGRVLEVAMEAMTADDLHHTLIIDEMNLARVEHYFAEVLSRIEDRRRLSAGGWASSALIQTSLRESDAEWGQVQLPANLAIIGTVNMDESAHGFSRKVLDRAFTIELSDVALDRWEANGNDEATVEGSRNHTWPVSAWWPRATRLSELADLTPEERARVNEGVNSLIELNTILAPAQLQVGYRTRDEIALFLLHADDIRPFFRTTDGENVEPLDLAVQMKILPRIVGGSAGIRRVLLGILGWATTGTPYDHEEDVREIMETWDSRGRPGRLPEARFPAVAGRACLMMDRLQSEGFTSYWL